MQPTPMAYSRMFTPRLMLTLYVLIAGTGSATAFSTSLSVRNVIGQNWPVRSQPTSHALFSRRPSSFALNLTPPSRSLTKIPDEDDTPIPFIDVTGSNFIECYADSVATLDGVTYTIGEPCDYAVALGYFDDDDSLVPVELDDELMDDVFPVAESIIEEEFGDELSLQRTPQTLTLVGELEEGEEDDGESGGDEDVEDDDAMEDDEEEVEILVSFEFKGLEFNLVRLLDPVLLVGKADPENPERRILLTPEESDEVMPDLEEMFLEYQEERDSMTF